MQSRIEHIQKRINPTRPDVFVRKPLDHRWRFRDRLALDCELCIVVFTSPERRIDVDQVDLAFVALRKQCLHRKEVIAPDQAVGSGFVDLRACEVFCEVGERGLVTVRVRDHDLCGLELDVLWVRGSSGFAVPDEARRVFLSAGVVVVWHGQVF